MAVTAGTLQTTATPAEAASIAIPCPAWGPLTFRTGANNDIVAAQAGVNCSNMAARVTVTVTIKSNGVQVSRNHRGGLSQVSVAAGHRCVPGALYQAVAVFTVTSPTGVTSSGYSTTGTPRRAC